MGMVRDMASLGIPPSNPKPKFFEPTGDKSASASGPHTPKPVFKSGSTTPDLTKKTTHKELSNEIFSKLNTIVKKNLERDDIDLEDPENDLPASRFSDSPRTGYSSQDISDIETYFSNVTPITKPESPEKPTGIPLDRSLCFGEDHTNPQLRDFLTATMPELAKNDFKILFVEHLERDSIAWREIANLKNSEKVDHETLEKKLDSYLRPIVGQFGATSYVNLIMEAWRHGLEVVPLETLRTRRIEAIKDEEFRIAAVNFEAVKTIQETLPPKGKAILLVGINHVNSFGGSDGPFPPIPGISELLGWRDVVARSDAGKMPDGESGFTYLI